MSEIKEPTSVKKSDLDILIELLSTPIMYPAPPEEEDISMSKLVFGSTGNENKRLKNDSKGIVWSGRSCRS